VGCGRIGARHAAILAGSPEVRLAACVEIDRRRVQEIAALHGCQAYLDTADMLAREEPDLVSFCTPSGLHAGGVIEAAAAGVPYIVVEKPMALRLDDADRMIRACDAASSQLFVVHQNRYNPSILRLREAMHRGRFGRLVLGTVRVRWCRPQSYYDQADWRGTWAMDGGVFSNQAAHHIDMLRLLMGEIDTVRAISSRRLVRIEAEDTGAAMLRFRNGALGIAEATTAARPVDLEGSISILGELGTVEVGGLAMNEVKVWKFQNPEPGDESVVAESVTSPPDVYGFGHRAFYKHVFAHIRTGQARAENDWDGRSAIEAICAIYESIATGREIRFPFSVTMSPLGRAGGRIRDFFLFGGRSS
jgi:predicted dehydrogenase